MNVLGLVVFSIVFGIVLGRMGDKGLPLKAFFETLNEVVMKMVTLVMWYVIKRRSSPPGQKYNLVTRIRHGHHLLFSFSRGEIRNDNNQSGEHNTNLNLQ